MIMKISEGIVIVKKVKLRLMYMTAKYGKRNGDLFFNKVHRYGLMLNVVWFQPYKYLSSFSFGAIYLVVLNFARHLRFKRKYVILVGIIPDMAKAPPTNGF